MTLTDEYKEGLKQATGGDKRWHAFMEGATDDEIKAGLGYHFGLGGGYHGDKVCNQHVGGKNPRITLYNGFDDDLNYVDEIHLHGKQLINHVRAIYNIPQPGQPKLF